MGAPFQAALRRRRGCRGGGRDVASRPFGYHDIMIAHARVRGRFSAAGPAGQQRKVPPALNGCGARSFQGRGSPGSINHRDGKGGFLTLPLAMTTRPGKYRTIA
jgi:hypothetical protein